MEPALGWIAPGLVALAISVVALVFAVAAWLRTTKRDRLEAGATDERAVIDQLARSLREGLDESLVRIRRAQHRLAELSPRGSEALQRSLGDLSRQLMDMKREAEHEIAQACTEISSRAIAVQEALARRIRHIEASLEVLRARAEIAAAEELAAEAPRARVGAAREDAFLQAEQLLEDAVVRIREVKLRLTDVIGEDPAFTPVLDASHEALHSIRTRTRDHKRHLDTVLSASDSLLAWLKSREPREPVVVGRG